jgi:YesN/AraC family two-component response regulator
MEPTILVVDDEKLTREGIVSTLAAQGWGTLLQASNGRDALLILRDRGAGSVDLMITDIRMPMMDGLELLAELDRAKVVVPTIVLSAHSDFSYAQKAIHYGVYEYLLKPIDPDNLVKAVAKGLNREAGRREGEIGLPDILRSSAFLEAAQQVWTPSIRQAIDYLMVHFAKAPGAREVADSVGLNPSYFCTLFKEKTGLTFGDFLLQVRLWNAKKLLVLTDEKIYAVAEAVGYTTARYFAKAFHDAEGMTPLEFRQRYRTEFRT